MSDDQNAHWEAQLNERDERIASLEKEVARLESNVSVSTSSTPTPAPSAPPVTSDQTKTIQELTASLKEAAASRETLLSSLKVVQTTMATLQAQVSNLEEENKELISFKSSTETKLKEAELHEEIIVTLRRSVEEARRGVMRLQTEKDSRRTSLGVNGNLGAPSSSALVSSPNSSIGLGIDMPFTAGSPSTGSVPLTSKRDKRASLNVGHGPTPPSRTSIGHRRVSSFSDIGGPSSALDPTTTLPLQSTGVRTGGLRELRLPQPSMSPTLPTKPGFFSGWGSSSSTAATSGGSAVPALSPPESSSSEKASKVAPVMDLAEDDEDQPPTSAASTTARQTALAKLESNSPRVASPLNGWLPPTSNTTGLSPGDPSGLALTSSPGELESLRSEINVLKRTLTETHAAREASEAACRALREFIASGGEPGDRSSTMTLSLPPLPSDLIDEDPAPRPRSLVSPSGTAAAPPARGWFSFRKASTSSATTPLSSERTPEPVVSPMSTSEIFGSGIEQTGRPISSGSTVSTAATAAPLTTPAKTRLSFFSSKSVPAPASVPASTTVTELATIDPALELAQAEEHKDQAEESLPLIFDADSVSNHKQGGGDDNVEAAEERVEAEIEGQRERAGGHKASLSEVKEADEVIG
ncbi:hypothetical protein [Phaffia rhodozyma]|uniref:Uncharacterized protein n=1 Tax=Phaffia rhodozyma TaxID=264483 RepID=A0A0F7SID9_PHARH|nr:hypothetical protein [Phaffia rhodozyma]